MLFDLKRKDEKTYVSIYTLENDTFVATPFIRGRIIFLLYLCKHQLHEYSAAVLESLSLLAVLRLHERRGEGGGDLRLEPARGHNHLTGEVCSVHHDRHGAL